MIKVKTTRFGEIEVQEKDLIELPHGLIVFPELKRYILLDHDKESPFKWLQSLDDGAIAFVIVNPLLFRPDFTVEVSEEEVSDLELKNEEDGVVSVIITMPTNPQNMTANLKAPLIFNLKNRKGKQLILSNPDYTTRHNIIEELKKRAAVQQTTQEEKVIEQAKEVAAEIAKPKAKAVGDDASTVSIASSSKKKNK